MYDTTKPYTKSIMNLIRQTWQSKYCTIYDDEYPVIRMMGNFAIDHTDGIGTKGYYHWNNKTFKEAAIDAFAMNINDLVMYGAIPCKMQNHIFLPEDNHQAIQEIVESLVELSKQYSLAMTGGETSIHQNMNGMDISITMTGLALSGYAKKNNYKVGDILVGLESNGLHSNGFTMVHNKLGGNSSEYTKPTKIYAISPVILEKASALNHITGGAFTKLKSNLNGVNAVLEFRKPPQEIFSKLFNVGIPSETMYKTFNCGYGFILGISEKDVERTLRDTEGVVIGKVVEGNGKVIINSIFDNEVIEL